MPATVTIRRWTGAGGGPTKSDITSINSRANAEDAHSTGGTSNPIRIPSAGTKYSYWVNTRLSCDVTPAGTINNLRWYTDGANGFGTGVTAKVATANTYGQATGTPGDTGDQLTVANYGDGVNDLNGAPSDAFAEVSGDPLAVDGSISNPSTGDFGDFVVYQLEVGTTAGPGATPTETFTWLYDET